MAKLEKSHVESALMDLRQDILEKDEQHTDAILQLEMKLDDYENRQRRKNLRISGLPEGIEGQDAIAFLQEWLPKTLG